MKTSPIRVLHLIASNFVGGPDKQILRHALDMRGTEFEVWIGSFREGARRAELLDRADEQGVPICEIPRFKRFDPRAIWDLANLLRAKEIQLLCTHGFKANTIGAIAKQLAGVPRIAFCRGWTAETWTVRLYELLDRCSLRFADRIVCVSGAQKRILEHRRTLRSRLVVVHNSALPELMPISDSDRARRKEELGFSAHTRLIGAVGRLSEEKGQRYLVEASARLAAEFDELKIVLLGEGRDREKLETQVKNLGLTNVVHLPGFQKNIGHWMGALDVLVNCSLTEGLPNVVLEAMAVGTPVVATAVGGVPELITDGESGILVPSEDAVALSRGVSKILCDADFASQLSQAGREKIKRDFSPSRQRDSLLALYRQYVGVSHVAGGAAVSPDAQALPPVLPEQSASAPLSKGVPADVLPFISVIIPIRNEERHLRSLLHELLSQDYPQDRYEILVADGNSTDRSAELVEEIAKSTSIPVRLLDNPRQLSSAGRNVGVRRSSGEFIVFIDGHCRIPARRLLRDTADVFLRTGADCLCRPQPLVALDGGWFQKVIADARATPIGHGLDSTIFSTTLEGFVDPTSSGASYRRTVFDEVGYYTEALDACEDVEFNYRVARSGLRSYISPSLTVQYQPRSSLSGLWKQLVRYGRGRFRFIQLHPDALSLGQVLPAAWLLWLFLAGAISLVSRSAASVYLLVLILYGLTIFSYSTMLGLRNGWRHFVSAPAVYFTIHAALGAGFLAESVRALRRRRSLSEANLARAAVKVISDRSPVTQSAPAPIVNAFSVDVEDYFQTEAMSAVVPREQWDHMPSRVFHNTMRLLELLHEHKVCGTFFFLGWVAQRFPHLVRQTVRLGHEIGCHSFWHRPVYRLSPSEFREDTLRAKTSIEDAGGVSVRGYRAPSFSMVQGTEWAAGILEELGFQYDSSVYPVRHDIYGNSKAPRTPYPIKGGRILELPIATIRVAGNNLPMGGGGYLRFSPYAYTRWAATRLNTQDLRPGIMYVHPWEIDPDQPRLAAPFRSKIRQYHGLGSTEGKLRHLLRDFHFAPIFHVFHQELANTPKDAVGRLETVANSNPLSTAGPALTATYPGGGS